MKSILYYFPLLFWVLNIYSQDTSLDYKRSGKDIKNEVRLGVIKSLSAGIIEVGYEYLLDRNQGFGINFLVHTNPVDIDYCENLAVNPYYRVYFSRSEEFLAKGFFAEGFLNVYNSIGDRYLYSIKDNTEEIVREKFFATAIGLAIGQKWINNLGFVLEIKAGFGRDILTDENKVDPFVFKGDVSIGYRF